MNEDSIPSITRDALLTLLKEDEVRRAICDIMDSSSMLVSTAVTEERIEPDKQSQEVAALKEEIGLLKEMIEKFKKFFLSEQCKTAELFEQNEKHKEHEVELQEGQAQLKKQFQSEKEQKEKGVKQVTSLSQENDELSGRIDNFKQEFSGILTAHQLYGNLSVARKAALKNIFKDDTLNGFWACGVQEKNVISLWEYIKSELLEGNSEELKELIQILDFFFSNYLLAHPLYVMQDVRVGEMFNVAEHIKHPDSSSSNGEIKQILLSGWRNVKTGKVVKQSVVVL
mgnify:CR=1 FL=1